MEKTSIEHCWEVHGVKPYDNMTDIKKAWAIHGALARADSPISKKLIDIAVAGGMIPLADLQHGATYLGVARRTYVGRWDSINKKFYYIREKFSSFFFDKVEHPEAEDGFDVFVPVKLIADGKV